MVDTFEEYFNIDGTKVLADDHSAVFKIKHVSTPKIEGGGDQEPIYSRQFFMLSKTGWNRVAGQFYSEALRVAIEGRPFRNGTK